MKYLVLLLVIIIVIMFFQPDKKIEGFENGNFEWDSDCGSEHRCCPPKYPLINRSRPWPKSDSFNRGWSDIGPCGPPMELPDGINDDPLYQDKLICSQHKELEEFRQSVKEFHKARKTALDEGQTIFHNPLGEYKEPLMDPTLPADKQPVMKGIDSSKLTMQGKCTLDANGDVVCNPTIWNILSNSIAKSTHSFMNQDTTDPKFVLLNNNSVGSP